MAPEPENADADVIFKALADPTRRQILKMLRKSELAAGRLAGAFTISGPSVSRHLSVLKAAGLVAERREANRVIYSLREARLVAGAGGWLLAVCPHELSALVAERKGKGKTSQKPAGKARHKPSPPPGQPNGASGGHSVPATELDRPATQANS